MGQCHLSALRAMEEIELVAACDVVEELLQRRADEFEVPRRYTDLVGGHYEVDG